jgi:hypothetical protein
MAMRFDTMHKLVPIFLVPGEGLQLLVLPQGPMFVEIVGFAAFSAFLTLFFFFSFEVA